MGMTHMGEAVDGTGLDDAGVDDGVVAGAGVVDCAGVVNYAGVVAGGGAGAVARSAGQVADGAHRTHHIDVTGRER